MDVTPGTATGPSGRWITVFAVVGTLLVLISFGTMLARGRPLEVLYARWLFHNAPVALVALWLGRGLERRQPGHGLSRLFLVLGGVATLHIAAMSLTDARLVAFGITDTIVRIAPAELPLDASIPLWISAWLWLPVPIFTGTLLLLLFPDGRLPSRRWRPLPPILVAGMLLLMGAYAYEGRPTSTTIHVAGEPPILHPIPRGLVVAGSMLVLVVAFASIASLGVRLRASTSDERRQLRAVVIAGALMALIVIVLWPWQAVWIPGSFLAIVGFFSTYGLAVLRNRLHDLDVAINRAAIGSILAALMTSVYLAVVVGVGSLVGRGSGNPLLPLLAAGVVGVLFEPSRRRVRRWVDRLLYGRDADAYEILSELSEQLQVAGSLDAILERVTTLLVRGTGAVSATITMTADGEPRRVAGHGDEPGGPPARSADIVHGGEHLGEIVLFARQAADLAPDAPVLLREVAGTLGPVLRNAALTAELEAQVEELRGSRQRLVTAHDEARRELERDIHDGAQARLVALRLQLGLATAVAEDQGAAALGELIDRLGGEADAAIGSLRDLSRGLSPPVLTANGIAAALRADVRALPLDVRIDAEQVRRFTSEVESAVYFSCLEAVKNAVTHAAAHKIRVAISYAQGELRFVVEDDGRGFDEDRAQGGQGLLNLRDRLGGLGGALTIDAVAGRGTRVSAVLPAEPLADGDPQPSGSSPTEVVVDERGQPLVSDR